MFGVSGLRAQQLKPRDSTRWARLRAAIAYGVWSACWIVGHVLGGGLLGALLGQLGVWLPTELLPFGVGLLGGCALIGGLHHLHLFRLPLPQLHRQVPRGWLHDWPMNLVALGYGLQLGCGVATRIRVFTIYVLFLLALLSGSALAGALVLGVFGAARSVLPVVLGRRLASSSRALGFAVHFDTYEEFVARLNGVVLLLAAVLLAGASWYQSP